MLRPIDTHHGPFCLKAPLASIHRPILVDRFQFDLCTRSFLGFLARGLVQGRRRDRRGCGPVGAGQPAARATADRAEEADPLVLAVPAFGLYLD